MSKKGVSKISGNPSPKVGEAVTYTVTDWYPSTPQNQRNPANVIWELFKKRSNGRFTTTNIKKTGVGNFTFGEVAQKHTYRLEAYLFEPEGEGASTIEVNPQPEVVPKIEKVELQYVDDSPGTVFSFTEKMRARAQCVNLNGKKLKFTLWEDDATGEGHDAKNLLIETKEATVDRAGVATAEFMLTRALMQKAMQGETDPQQLEFYVTVEYFSHNKHATDNVNVNNPLHTPAPNPQSRPQQPANNHTPPAQSTPETPSNNAQPRAENSPAAEKPASQMEERGVAGQDPNPSEGELHDYQEAQGTIEAEKPSTPQANEGKTVSIVEDSSVEELLDAYFAKKEYTKQTGEAAGTLEYKFGSNGNKTATDAEKEKIAKIILGKPAVKALADKKEYTTLEAIKQALSKEVYNKDEKISFQTFKLGAELKKITSAPLDTKLYLVAKTAGSGLSDKQATIIIKEKDGLIKGSAGAVLPILEISEEQMDQATPTTGEVPGTEKSEFTGKIENGMVKIPVHLRPKSDDELKEWKEKISKGKEDGEYTYKFGGENKVTDENSKKRVAEAILKNAKNGNTNNEKIADGKTAYIDDIEKALEIKTYQKDQTIKFKLYKKEKELLYLQAKAQGEKQHDKEFLKADGEYFEVGKTKYIIFPLLIKPRNDVNGANSRDYWGEDKTNQTTYEYNRDGGARKHAARDLETESNETVVAIAGGTVLEAKAFYLGTHQVTIHHTIPDGREFIVRYGELDPDSLKVSKGDTVTQKQELGKTGKMTGISRYMIHFEQYTGAEGFEVENYRLTQNDNPPFNRRKDLIDPLEILQEGYRNTFESGESGDRVNPDTLTFSQNGLDFLKGYEKEIKRDGKHVYFDDDYEYCTIGYGHLIAGKNSCANITIPQNFVNGLTDAEANTLLANDVSRISNLVKSKVTVNLYQYEFDALVSLAFNVEAAVGSDSTLLRKLNAEDYEGAADEFKNWRKAGGVVAPGLVKRRAQETDIFKNNVYDSTH